MPHLVLFETAAGTEAIYQKFGLRSMYYTWLRNNIADAFSCFCKEDLDKNTQIPIHEPVATSSMPIDVLLVVVFWKTENRLGKQMNIQSHMQLALFNNLQDNASITVNASAIMVDEMPANLVQSLINGTLL